LSQRVYSEPWFGKKTLKTAQFGANSQPKVWLQSSLRNNTTTSAERFFFNLCKNMPVGARFKRQNAQRNFIFRGNGLQRQVMFRFGNLLRKFVCQNKQRRAVSARIVCLSIAYVYVIF
jgi:hypothetical protein